MYFHVLGNDKNSYIRSHSIVYMNASSLLREARQGCFLELLACTRLNRFRNF